MSKSEEHGSRSNIACATKTQAQTEARHKSQRVSKAKQKEERETEKRSRVEQSRAQNGSEQSRVRNQEIPLDTSAFIRHYNEFL